MIILLGSEVQYVSDVVHLSITKLVSYWYSVYKRAASAFTKSNQSRYLLYEQTITVAQQHLVRVVIVCG